MNYIGNEPRVPVTLGSDSGRLVQSRSHVRGDYLAQNGIIPLDDTIPQITEGLEFFTIAAYAPLFVGSRVRLRALVNMTNSAQQGITGALFRAGTPDALAVASLAPVADTESQFAIEYEFIAASVAPFTYSLRFGSNASSLIRINGRTVRNFGGAYSSWFRIDEWAP